MSNQQESDRDHSISSRTRRDFGRLALGGAVATKFASRASRQSPALRPIPPGIKIGTGGGPATPENLRYLKQLGITWVSLAATPANATAGGFTRMRQEWEDAGFRVYNIGSGVGPSGSLHNMPEVTLNLPGRDQKIDEYLNYIRYLGKAGIPYTTYAHMGNGIWSSGRVTTPRGYEARDMDTSSPNWKGSWAGKTYTAPLSHGRVFSPDEIWDNYAYFIRKVVPVAEEAGVRIGIHPDDPPLPILAGVPRCIFSSFEGYRRALEIADSPNVGMCLCVGCWLEGGPLMGKDPVGTIKYFGSRKKLFKVHFRNVTAPLPHSTETLLDDGYYDMYKVMKALVEVKFDGIAIPDHIPGVGIRLAAASAASSDASEYRPSVGLAYLISYMRALLKAVNSELRGGE
jgi:mannonate dehydratase